MEDILSSEPTGSAKKASFSPKPTGESSGYGRLPSIFSGWAPGGDFHGFLFGKGYGFAGGTDVHLAAVHEEEGTAVGAGEDGYLGTPNTGDGTDGADPGLLARQAVKAHGHGPDGGGQDLLFLAPLFNLADGKTVLGRTRMVARSPWDSSAWSAFPVITDSPVLSSLP